MSKLLSVREELRAIVASLLKQKKESKHTIDIDRIGYDEDITTLGLDSLDQTELMMQIEDLYGRDCTDELDLLLANGDISIITLERLAEVIETAGGKANKSRKR